jgi:hypothetical protein
MRTWLGLADDVGTNKGWSRIRKLNGVCVGNVGNGGSNVSKSNHSTTNSI